jgi:hypothetical protein
MGIREQSHYFPRALTGTRASKRKALVGLALLCVGCLDDPVVGTTTLTGAYVLRSLNGSPPPAIVSGSGDNKTEVIDDVITFFEGGSYAENGHTRITVNGQTTDGTIFDTGRYSPLGTSIALNSTGGGTRSALSTDGKSLTIVEAGVRWVFTK